MARLAAMALSLAGLLCGSVVPAADAAANPAAPAVEAAAPSVQIGAGDTLTMQVFGNAGLATTGDVADDGSIRLPLIGAITVVGLSPEQAAAKIAKAYADGDFLVRPEITITLKESRSQRVVVLGSVGNPGSYPITRRTTIFDLLAAAGGVGGEGSTIVYLIRKDADGRSVRTEIDLSQMLSDSPVIPDVGLAAGDMLFVPAATKTSCYVLGEVTTPGAVKFEPGMTVLDAVARAGGVTRRGSGSRVELKRKNPNGSVTTRSVGQADRLQPDDVITVKESIF